MSDPNVPRRLLDLAQSKLGPRTLSEAGLRERFGDPADVEVTPGQVWRARWDQTTMLVLLHTVDDRKVRAMPVTIDPSAEDEHCLVASAPITAFGVEVTVWAGLAHDLPLRVLDRLIDIWDDDLVRQTTTLSHNQLQPPGTRRGRRLLTELAPDAQFRAELADDLEKLSLAPGLPVESPEVTYRDLATLLGGRLDLGQLCACLDLPQPEVMKIVRGKTPLTSAQADAIAGLTGLSADEIAATVRPLPLGLVISAEHPRWRPTWVRRARQRRLAEADARLIGSYGAFGMAARETGGDSPNWNERLRHFIDADDAAAQGT